MCVTDKLQRLSLEKKKWETITFQHFFCRCSLFYTRENSVCWQNRYVFIFNDDRVIDEKRKHDSKVHSFFMLYHIWRLFYFGHGKRNGLFLYRYKYVGWLKKQGARNVTHPYCAQLKTTEDAILWFKWTEQSGSVSQVCWKIMKIRPECNMPQ